MSGDTFIQPKITGYRQLGPAETALMNKIKALGVELGSLVAELRSIPQTPPPTVERSGPVPAEGWYGSTIDQRWVSIGATHLQTGLMALTRAVAQPTTF